MEFLLFVSWVALAALVGWVTNTRGKGFGLGFFVSLIFSPLIGLLVAIAIPAAASPADGRASKEQTRASETSPSAIAWQSTSQSVSPEDYADFLLAFPGTTEALPAAKQKRQLETWQSLDSNNPDAVLEFSKLDLFPALRSTVAKHIQARASSDQRFAEILAGQPSLATAEAQISAIDPPFVFLFESSGGPTRAVCFSPDSKYIVAGGARGVYVWDTVSALSVLTRSVDMVLTANIIEKEETSWVSAVSVDGFIKTWDLASGSRINSAKLSAKSITSAAINPEDSSVIVGLLDGSIRQFDSVGNPIRNPLIGHSDRIVHLRISKQQQRCVSSSLDGTSRVWDIPSGKELQKFDVGHGSACADMTQNGELVAIGSADGSVGIWSCDSGKEIVSFRGHKDKVTSVAFSPDEAVVLTASYDGTLKIWDRQSGKVLLSVSNSSGPVSCAAFDPSSNRIVTGSSDGSVRITKLRI